MNLDEMFRHFFGFRDYPDTRRGFFEDYWSENPEDDFRNQDPRNFGQEEGDFHLRTFTSPFGIMKHFEELFRNFGLADFPSVGKGQHFHQLEPPDIENDLSPRERMLKDQEISPHFNKPWYEGILEKPESRKKPTDSDLDVEVSEGGLSNLIPTPHIKKNPYSFFSSVSIRTIRGADGKLEEHRTTRDSTGKEETTVRRVIGNESHSVTTLMDSDGLKEKREDFTNMNEDGLKSFNNKWAKQGPQSENLPATGDSSYGNIFRKIFGFSP